MRSRRRQLGVTLPELLAVVALMGLVTMVAVPNVQRGLRRARARDFVISLEQSLRASRMIAVARQAPQALRIEALTAPSSPADTLGTDDYFEFENFHGDTERTEVPPLVTFTSPTTTTEIQFRANGAVLTGGVTVVIEAAIDDTDRYTDRWTLSVGIAGNTNVVHETLGGGP